MKGQPFFPAIPVALPSRASLPDPDDRLLAAWGGVSTDRLAVMVARSDERSFDVRATRRRVLALRDQRGIGR